MRINVAMRRVRATVVAEQKWSRYRPGVAQGVGRGIALLFHDRGTRRGWVVSSTPRPHFTTGKPSVPILQEAGWTPGPVRTGGKSRPHWNSIPDRPARSQSLYRRCRAKAIGITHAECVLVALRMQHAMRMRHIATCGLPRSTIFFHIISQTARFSEEKKVIEHELCVWLSALISSEKFLIPRGIEGDIILNVHNSSCTVRVILASC